MKKLFTISFVFFFFCSLIVSRAGTYTAIASTNFTVSTTWSPSGRPPCGSTIIIPAGFTVTVTSVENYASECSTPMRIEVYGRLIFDGGKLKLPPSSEVYIFAGGSVIETGPGGGNSSTVEVGGTILWNADSPPISGPSSLPNGLLPIELTYFKGKVSGPNKTQLNWQTATELNNQFFTVERSPDGLNFESIHTLNGAGNSNSIKNYEWIDPTALSGANYYRLKQTDFDGKFAYSAIEFIDHNNFEVSLNVYPNPSDGDVTVVIPGGISSNVKNITLKVTNLAGKTIMESKLDYSNHQLNVSLTLEKGFYYISVESPGSKLVKLTTIH